MTADVIFEGKQDTKFLDQVAALPEGERLRSCLQCGTCSGTCPIAALLPHTPRRLFAMIRAGMKKEVLESATPWVCSSCYECTVKCPAEIKITEINYALKRMAAEEGISPPDSDAIRFAQLFTDIVKKYGRAQELQLLMKYMMFAHPLQMIKQSGLGLRMFLKGRMPIAAHTLKDMDGFSKMVKRADELEEATAQ
jgi:heterodisulfide reductase subunit C